MENTPFINLIFVLSYETITTRYRMSSFLAAKGAGLTNLVVKNRADMQFNFWEIMKNSFTIAHINPNKLRHRENYITSNPQRTKTKSKMFNLFF